MRYRMFMLGVVAALSGFAADSNTNGHCVILEAGERERMIAPSCFHLTVSAPTRFHLSQPRDLTVHLRSLAGSIEVRIDAFEFGAETVTVTYPGQYRLDISETKPRAGLPFRLSMSATVVTLQLATKFAEAEALSTSARRTAESSDAELAVKKWREIGESRSLSRALLRLGDVELGHGRLESALRAYEEARELCGAVSDVRCVAEAANNAGVALLRLGDILASERRLQEATDQWAALHDSANEGRTHSVLGLLRWQSGDYQGALISQTRASILTRGLDDSAYPVVLNNLGITYLSLHEHDRAVAILTQSLAERRRRSAPRAMPTANLGWAYLLGGQLSDALPMLLRANERAILEGDNAARAIVLVNLGETYRRLGFPEKSYRSVSEGLALAKEMGDHQTEGGALLQLGLLAATQGHPDEARAHLEQSIAVRRASAQRDLESESLVALAELEHRAGNRERASELAQQALALLESIRAQVSTPALRASFYSRKRGAFDLLLDLAPDAEASLLLAERTRGRALLDLLTGDSLALAPKDLAAERLAVQRRIGFLSSGLAREKGEGDANSRNRLQLLLAENDAIEARIRQAVGSEALGRPVASIDEIQRQIPPDSALLEFHLGKDKGYLWLVEPGAKSGVRMFPLPVTRQVVEARVQRAVALFNAIAERRRNPETQAKFEAAWNHLSATLLGPLRGVPLPARLIFVLDGALHKVPIAALRRPGFARAIGLTHELLMAPSASFLAQASGGAPRRATKEFAKAVLAVADPVFSSRDPRVTAGAARTTKEQGLDLPRLPFTGEIDALRVLVPASRLDVARGFAANAAALDRRRLRDYAVLHLSTHTIIDNDEPQMSRIALSMVNEKGAAVNGGALHPQRLSQWQLDKPLVVLSSCDTALGKMVMGEGLAGFTSALFLAGAAQLVLTTNQVDAEASSEFFTHFYRSYFGGGPSQQGRTELALTRARRAMAGSARWGDPYYWAGFAGVGQPSGER